MSTHPGGTPSPSEADINFLNNMRNLGTPQNSSEIIQFDLITLGRPIDSFSSIFDIMREWGNCLWNKISVI